MGYAKDYNIPRAVMYDQHIDENNPMFDLNRDLIKEQKDITIKEILGIVDKSNLTSKLYYY